MLYPLLWLAEISCRNCRFFLLLPSILKAAVIQCSSCSKSLLRLVNLFFFSSVKSRDERKAKEEKDFPERDNQPKRVVIREILIWHHRHTAKAYHQGTWDCGNYFQRTWCLTWYWQILSGNLGDCVICTAMIKGKRGGTNVTYIQKRELEQEEGSYKMIPLGLCFLAPDLFGRLIPDPRGGPRKSEQKQGVLLGRESTPGLQATRPPVDTTDLLWIPQKNTMPWNPKWIYQHRVNYHLASQSLEDFPTWLPGATFHLS